MRTTTDTMTVRDEMWSGRVDRAWRKGYEAGRQQWRRFAVVELIIATAAICIRPRTPFAVKVIAFWLSVLFGFLALAAVPFVAAFFGVRWAVRRRRGRRPPADPELVTLSDGSTF